MSSRDLSHQRAVPQRKGTLTVSDLPPPDERNGLAGHAIRALRAGLVAAALVGSVGSGVSHGRTGFVPALVTTPDGKAEEYELADMPVRFLTVAGPLALRVGDWDTLTTDAEKGNCRLTTIHGDVWIGKPEERGIPYVFLGQRMLLPFFAPPVARITVRRSPFSNWRPREHAKALMRDGSQAFLAVDAFVLPVQTSQGTWDLPMGSMSVMTLKRSAPDSVIEALVRFPSGHVEDLRLLDRGPSLRVQDTFGNSLSLPIAELSMVLGRIGVADAQARDIAANQELAPPTAAPARDRATLLHPSGRSRDIDLPFLSLALRTTEGDIVFPSPVLRAIEWLTPGQTVRIETVYGETFVGSATMRKLEGLRLTEGGQAAERSLVPGGCIRIPGPSKPVPPGWLFWRLRAGNAFCARLADEDPHLVIRPAGSSQDSRIPTDQVIAIRPLNKLFAITTSTGATIAGRFARPEQAVVALSTGTRLAIPWSRIHDVTNASPSIQLADWATNRVVSTTNRESEIAIEPAERRSSSLLDRLRRSPGTDSPPKKPSEPVPLVLRTDLGAIALPTNVLAAIHASPKGKVSLVETVFGEVFVADRVSEKDLKATGLVIPPSAGSSGGMPVSLRWAAVSALPPPDSLAWRLRTGHVLYARPLVALRGALTGSAPRDIEVPPDDLVSLVPAEENAFDVGTRGGPRRVQPRSVSLSVRGISSASKFSIRLEDIECVARGLLRDLPPPVSFRPECTPLQESTVLFASGSFSMGRTRDEGNEDEIPARTVRVGSFHMDACEVTRAQFAEFALKAGFKTDAERINARVTWRAPGFRQSADEPVVGVTWTDAAQYCNWRSREAGLQPCYEFGAPGSQTVCRRDRTGYRLPTEAEWEYAARGGGTDVLFPWGDDRSPSNAVRRANFEQTTGAPQDGWIWTSPVKAFPPTPSGLYGMAGNAWEWCEDWYDPRTYAATLRFVLEDPCAGINDLPGLSRRAMRGGSYANGADMLRCASRGHGVPTAWTRKSDPPHVGFRCVRTVRRP